MAEASAVGILPHVFWRYTPRDLYAAFTGARTARIRQRQGELWAAWQTANFTRAKKLPALQPLLRKLEAPRVMSKREIRVSILTMAQAFGAKVIHKKRGDP